ncbi:NAC domain-containing protein 105-like [Pyrus communis]|uniref:NAC domain-containing protein 105-like n=1 Tax=Pyrus communis TaxID=23211 RepID=UPI0035BF87CC
MGSSSSSIAPEEGDAVRVNVSRLPGFGFSPTDELLIRYYLKNKIEGTDSHFRRVFPEIDLSKYEPGDIPPFVPEVNANEWVFFTRPKYKDSRRCPRRDRLTHQGFYKITGDEREIRAEESKDVIGKKIILTFHEGRGPKAKKSDWVIHEYYCTKTEVGSEPTKQMDFVLCRLKNRSPSYKKPKGDPTLGELPDSGANSEDDQAAGGDVIPGPVEHLGYKELGDVNNSESPDGSCLIDCINILSFDDGDDETGDGKFPDLDDPAASARFLELRAEMEEILNSPPQTPHQTPLDYLSSTFLSSGNIQLGAVLQDNGTSDDCNTIQSPFGDNNYSYTDKNDISTCDEGEPHSFTVSDFENKVVDDMSQELCVQPQKDMDLLQLHVAQQSPTYTKLEDFMEANIFYDACIEWQPQIGDEYSHVNCKNNISTNDNNEPVSCNAFDLENLYTDNMILEPCVQPEKYLRSVLHADICDNGYNNWQPTCWDKDSYLTDKKNISTNDKDKQYSSIASNFDNQATNKRKR